jgi:hypothetical protein
VIFQFKAILVQDGTLGLIHGSAGEFNYFPAAGTNEMMMMMPAKGMLEPRNTVVKHDFASKPAFGYQFHCPINGRITDLPFSAIGNAIDIFSGHMILGIKEGVQNQRSLTRFPQSF